MQNGDYFGIDFGTTNTSVYLFHYDSTYGCKETKFSSNKEIANPLPYPSYIAIPNNGGECIFGRVVKSNTFKFSNDYTIIKSFKSLLGTSKEVIVDGKRYNGEILTAMFLSYVINDSKIGNNAISDIKDVVFSIPVDFDSNARKDLIAAAKRAGLNIRGFVSESSSAYISKVSEIKAYSKVMVIDWGGGTLDLSILSLRGNNIYEEAVYGVKIGGDDIDEELAKRICPKVFPDIPYDSLSSDKKDKLLAKCEEMKINYSVDDDSYDMVLGPGSHPTEVTYDFFNGVVSPIVNESVLGAINKIMNMANVRPDGIDAIILAGGSSGLRPFAEAVMNIFGEDKIIFDDSYQWMVAKGAAITNAIECHYILNDDICLLMSDDSLYPILKKDVNQIGEEERSICFSLTDDSSDAHFIFTDSHNRFTYATASVKTKGFLNEIIKMSYRIDNDQICKIRFENDRISANYHENIEINKLRFYYDLTEMEALQG